MDAGRDAAAAAGSDRAGRECLELYCYRAVDGGVCGAAERELLLGLALLGILVCNFKYFDLSLLAGNFGNRDSPC